MGDEKKFSGYVETEGKCLDCRHVFTQRLQIGEYPFCPRCGSSDIGVPPDADIVPRQEHERANR